jgi:hypothetical protein
MIHDDNGDVTVAVLKCTEFQRQTRPFSRSDIQLHCLYEVLRLLPHRMPRILHEGDTYW